MKSLILAASFLALSAAGPAWAQSTTPSTSSQTPAATAPANGSAAPAMKGNRAHHPSMSRKKARKGSSEAQMNREMKRQSSPATGKKNAATDSDTAQLNQQELGRISKE
jgi:hypothetical protein